MYTSTKNAEQFISNLIKYMFMLMVLVLGVQITYDVLRAIYAAGQARTIALGMFIIKIKCYNTCFSCILHVCCDF